MKKKFKVEGMTCSACQAHVQKAVSKVEGVNNVNVNLLSNSMEVEIENENIISQIERAVSKAGYKAYIKGNKEKTNEEKDYSLIELIFSFIFLLVLMYVSMGHMIALPLPAFLEGHENSVSFAFTQLLLVLPIIYIYRRYFISGYKKLLKGSPNMDSLIAIGATASLIYGIFAIYMLSYGLGNSKPEIVESYHHNLYFESAGMILTLVSLGKYLEKLSKKKTTTSLTKLMDLAPKKALIEVDNEINEISIEEVKKGDILIVKKGEQVPVDGVIIEGSCSLDQSNITGESIPLLKVVNDEVFASTINTAGFIKIKATKVGEDSSINTIIKLVEEASSSKAPISKLVDKIAGIFVPLIMLISSITLIVSLATKHSFELSFNFAISVLVIACPCALGLATPVAIMVGTGKGAESGLLIKNAEILEKAHLIKTVVLDKTGTITEGKPKVIDFISFSEENIVDIIYSIENKSEHPLASAICDFMIEKGAKEIDISDYKSLEGKGLEGKFNDEVYYIGNCRYLMDNNIINAKVDEQISMLSNEGKTPLVVVKNKLVIAIISIKDQVKKTSIQAIKELTRNGIKVIMLTGDNKITAEKIAKEVGISQVISEVLPQDKQKVILSLKKDDKNLVAMVGDGVNDALALTSSDLGIAIGGGSDIALESSDIVLLRNDLLDILNVINLSKRVLNTIKGNLFWAFFYNCIGIVLASGLFYDSFNIKLDPMIGSLAMSFSSVFVVLNALTINFFKVKKSKEYDEKKKIQQIKVLEFNIEGMMCPHCQKCVEEEALSVVNVLSAKTSLEIKNLIVEYQDEIDIEEIICKVENQGYRIKVRK